MTRYRVITNRYGGYFAQERGWFFWHTLGHPTRLNFSTKEEAVQGIRERMEERKKGASEKQVGNSAKQKAGRVVHEITVVADEFIIS